MFSWLPINKTDSWASKVADESTGRQDFFSKIFDIFNIVGRPIRGLFGRPDKSLGPTK